MFGRKKTVIEPENKTYLALDIGTEFIKTVLFRIKEGKVKVIGYDRTPQKSSAMRGALIINLEQVIDVVDISIGHAVEMAQEVTGEAEVPLPSSAVMGIAGELVKGVVIEVNVDREEVEKKITDKEINGIVSQIKKQAFDNAKEEIAIDTGIRTDQIVEIDTVIDSVFIDGVRVTSPIGFKGQELVYKVFSTFAPKIHVDSIKEVADALNLKVMGIVVEPYALAMGVQNARTERFSGIFIDIGGGTTDIAYVDKGSIVGTKMFAYGGRVFTKRIEEEFGVDYSAAERMKVDYSDQKLTDSESKQIKKAMSKDMPVWLDGVEIALSEFEDVPEYPAQILICGGGSLLPEIEKGLIAHPWLQVLPFGKFPKVSFLFPNQIENVIDLTKKATNPVDVTPLALARMALDLVEN